MALPIGRIVLVGVAVRAVGAEAGHDLHYIEKFGRVCVCVCARVACSVSVVCACVVLLLLRPNTLTDPRVRVKLADTSGLWHRPWLAVTQRRFVLHRLVLVPPRAFAPVSPTSIHPLNRPASQPAPLQSSSYVHNIKAIKNKL